MDSIVLRKVQKRTLTEGPLQRTLLAVPYDGDPERRVLLALPHEVVGAVVGHEVEAPGGEEKIKNLL